MTTAESFEPGELILGAVDALQELDPVSQSYQLLRDKIAERVILHASLGDCSRARNDAEQHFTDFMTRHMSDLSELTRRHLEQLRAEVTDTNQSYHDCLSLTVDLDEELMWLPAPLEYSEDRAREFGLDGLLLRHEEWRQWGTKWLHEHASMRDDRPQYIRREPGQIDTQAVGRMLSQAVEPTPIFSAVQSIQEGEVYFLQRES